MGRAGILALPLPTLNVGVVPAGGIGFNAFGGYADYINAGPPIAIGVASFMTGTIALTGAPGDFGAVSVRCRVQIGAGVGLAFVPTSTFFLPDIVARFDGLAGPLPDNVFGSFVVSAFPNANTMTFSAVSTAPLVVNNGATVRVTATSTVIGDPMTFVGGDVLDPSVAANLPDDFVGFGPSGDAEEIMGLVSVPAVSDVGLMALGALVVVCGWYALQRMGPSC
jgi:hypothetical protein